MDQRDRISVELEGLVKIVGSAQGSTKTKPVERCCVPGCGSTNVDLRGLIEFVVLRPPYRDCRPVCTAHFDLLIEVGLRVVGQ